MELIFSIIIPVYNRPKEVDELLKSLTLQDFSDIFEIIIVEDGSKYKSDGVIIKYKEQLNIHYFLKHNSGAGASRNYGMKRATGTYFIILDSDVILPPKYLSEVKKKLQQEYTDAFGGPDMAHKNFTPLQKAINYSMTSILTTGGIRGKKNAVGTFQPRSFNFGISKQAFAKTGGFLNLKTAEDIDLTFRLWNKGYKTQLIQTAFVYHKRRTTLQQFYKQVFYFGVGRSILNKKYPTTSKITYWFPSLFISGFCMAILLVIFGYWKYIVLYAFYFLAIFLDSLIKNKNIKVALLSISTSFTQFLGYGMGFLQSKWV